MACIALKVDVDTLKGTREGVPRLLEILARVGARATFLFSLGPDHTGRALGRLRRPGFLSKVRRTSVLRHYGLRTLLYGVVLPGPDIGRRAGGHMRSARDAGHECGIHAWDHVLWQDRVRESGAQWTRAQMELSYARFEEVFGAPPTTHGAAGWQMNPAAFRQLDDWGIAYASDTRGGGPCVPVVEGRELRHVELPTTLPTFDELLGLDGIDEQTIVPNLLARTAAPVDQVFTLHAELEGGLLSDACRRLLEGWREQGHDLVSLAMLFERLDRHTLRRVPIGWASVPGRAGDLTVT